MELAGLYAALSNGSCNLHTIIAGRGNNSLILRLGMEAVHKVHIFVGGLASSGELLRRLSLFQPIWGILKFVDSFLTCPLK